jgi:hypothetical protein
MDVYFYIVRSTTGDNVGQVRASSQNNAEAWLQQTFTPTKISQDAPTISYKIIDEHTYNEEKQRIDAERIREANA